MAATLGSYDVGGFQVSGRAAGGATETTSTTPSQSASLSEASGGQIVTLRMNDLIAGYQPKTGSFVLGGESLGESVDTTTTSAETATQTLIGSGVTPTTAISVVAALQSAALSGTTPDPVASAGSRGAIGSFTMGAETLGNDDPSGGLTSAQTSTFGGSLSEGISGGVTALTTNSFTATVFREAIAGNVQTLLSTPSEAGKDIQVGQFTLGGEKVGYGVDTTETSAGETETLTGSGADVTTEIEIVTSPQSVNTNPTIGDPLTRTGIVGEIGGGLVGSQTLGDEQQTAQIQSPTLSSLTVDPLTETAAIVPTLTGMAVSRLLSDSLSEAFSGGWTPSLGSGGKLGAGQFGEIQTVTQTMDTNTFLADSLSEGIAGETVTLSVDVFGADVFTEATAEVVGQTLTITPLEAIRFLPDWAIFPGPRIVEDTQEEVRTHDSLTITWRVTEELLVDVLRPQLSQSGKVDVVERIDGGFDAVPRASEANEIQLQPATGREDIRPIRTYYVDDYEETPRGTGAGEWEVEVELIPEKEKAHDNEHGTFGSEPTLSADQTEHLGQFQLGAEDIGADDSDFWYFQFDFGDVLSRRVSADVERSPNDTIPGATLNIVVLKDEARVIEENAGKLGAKYLREVPDGEDLLEDTSNGNRNTVTISPPDVGTNTLEPGDYLIDSFETTWNQVAYVLELNVSAL